MEWEYLVDTQSLQAPTNTLESDLNLRGSRK